MVTCNYGQTGEAVERIWNMQVCANLASDCKRLMCVIVSLFRLTLCDRDTCARREDP